MKSSRIGNAIKNVGVATAMQIITLLLSFVSRTYFVRLLGNDYLSCDGLFSNILTVLSFSELGIGSAIIFNLYKPIAENDRVQIGKLMNLFRSAYRYIALFISICGLAVIPFLPFIVTEVPDIKESIESLYCLFLANTVVSYFWGYKKSYLIANQENYIVLLIQQGASFVRIMLQIVFLIRTHNYILYLLISIVCTLLVNIATTIYVDKKYPWINEYLINKLTKKEKEPIFSNILAIVQYKLGAVILNGTDNIIISAFLKTTFVGICSNYNLVIGAVTTVSNQACSGLQAIIGNYNTVSNKDDRYSVFSVLYFVSFWVFGFFSVALATLLSPFVCDVWLGKEYALSYDVVIALALSFYINFINIIPSTYRTTMGYFKEARMCPVYASVINILLSILLAKMVGLSGVFFATSVSRMFTFNIIDPYYVFKKGFGKSVLLYFEKFALYSGSVLIVYCFSAYTVSLIHMVGWGGFVLKAIVVTLICNGSFLVMFFHTQVFKQTISILKGYFFKRKG